MAPINTKATLAISSPAFKHEAFIPSKYTCEGENINPAVNIKGIPEDAVSLVLIMDDPDAPGGVYDHWVVWNIQPADTIKENSVPGKTAKNSRGDRKYTGPCPPSGTHRYFFKIYALDKLLDLDEEADKRLVERAMHDRIVAYGELIGLYKKHN
jgi:Raf kinase inhibitor-like YbhB/YbcL family protein